MQDINGLIADLNKSYGGDKAIIKRANELPPLRTFPFNIPSMDLDLGGGALWGRTTILAGAKGSGKTSSAYSLGGHANSIGIPVYWFDLEKAFDIERAKIFGMIPELTYVVRGELTAENIFQVVRDTIRYVKTLEDSRAIFIVDSMAGMVIEKLMEDAASSQFGGSARVINQAVAVWQIILGDNQILIEINQLRDKLGGMGEPDMMPGGRGQEYWSSATIWTRAGETLKNGTTVTGQEMRWTIKKSRGSNPKEIGMIGYDYQTGFMREECLIAVAVEMEIIQRTGAWYVLTDGKKVHGQAELIAELKGYPEFMADLKEQVYSKMPIPEWNGLDV